LIALGVAAYAAETISYTYDARGRLVRVVHAGTVNNNIATNYTYDAADNLTNKTTTGSPNPPPP
jgi:YD repeat-containing protein